LQRVDPLPRLFLSNGVLRQDQMGDKLQIRGTEDIARKWHALAERRREHFTDLHNSGRWRKYYREHNFPGADARDGAHGRRMGQGGPVNGAPPAKINGGYRHISLPGRF